MARLLERYKKEIVPKLKTDLNVKNNMVVPRLEKVVVSTIESGFMTKDLALLVGADQAWLSTQGFIDKIDENLRSAVVERQAA